MVGRDVEPHRDMGAEGLEQLELVGRQLQHVDAAVGPAAPGRARRGRYCRRPRSARRPRLRIWPISAVVVDLPLVPVMPTNRALAWARASSSTSQMIGLPAARAAAATGCGSGKVLRNAGADHQRGDAATSRCAAGSATFSPACAAASREAALSSQADVVDAGRLQGACRSPGRSAPAPARRTTNPSGCRDRSSAHRSFRVARPAIARMAAMIQKRMTMVGSAQPFCSK